MAEKNVRPIQIAGEQPVHVFRTPQGLEVDIPCPRREYDGLRGKGARPPTPPVPGSVWLYSAVRATFDVGVTRKDDCMISPNGDAVLFTGGDAYRGGIILLDRDEYQPRIENGKLITTKAVPDAVAAVPADDVPVGVKDAKVKR